MEKPSKATEKKISDAINELVRLHSKKKRLRRSEIIGALDLVSEAFDSLTKDESINQSIESAVDLVNNPKSEELLSESRKFENTFLANERAALSDAGINHEAREVIISKIRPLRKNPKLLVNDLKKFQPMVGQAKEHIDDAALRLKKPDEDFKKKKKGEKILGKAAGALCGGAVVAVNSGLSLPTATISNFSMAIGGGLAADCIKELIEELISEE